MDIQGAPWEKMANARRGRGVGVLKVQGKEVTGRLGMSMLYRPNQSALRSKESPVVLGVRQGCISFFGQGLGTGGAGGRGRGGGGEGGAGRASRDRDQVWVIGESRPRSITTRRVLKLLGSGGTRGVRILHRCARKRQGMQQANISGYCQGDWWQSSR